MRLTCWRSICSSHGTLDWERTDFSPCKTGRLAHLSVCQSNLKWPPEGDPCLHQWTCPFPGSAFMRKYRSNPSWVGVQLATKTSNTAGLAGNRTSKASLLNTVQKRSQEDFLKGMWLFIPLGALNPSLDSPDHPCSESFWAPGGPFSLILWCNWSMLREMTWNYPM